VIPPAAALRAAAEARVTLVIGAGDTGKSTLVACLASALAAAGHTVAVVDADLGQSDVGPPTTVGLGRVRAPLERLEEADVVGLEFLGVTSPARCMRETAAATARLVARALDDGCDRVLVDTSGLVAGDFGRALKRIKIDRVRPDVLIALQRADECEPILGHYADGPVRIVRLPALATTRRSPAERARRRRHALDAHLAGATPVTVDVSRIAMRPAPPTRGLAVIEVDGVLVGLDDAQGRTRGLGWVSAVDAAKARLTVETTVDADAIAAVAIGRERYRAA
jgi:polynucleotide 5'-hydroxyl-kinase GRC3/NOL9